MDENNIDSIFRERFGEAEKSPSPEVWRRIEAALDEQAAMGAPRRRRKNMNRYAAAAVLLLVAGIAFLIIQIQRPEEITTPKPATEIARQPTRTTLDPERSGQARIVMQQVPEMQASIPARATVPRARSIRRSASRAAENGNLNAEIASLSVLDDVAVKPTLDDPNGEVILAAVEIPTAPSVQPEEAVLEIAMQEEAGRTSADAAPPKERNRNIITTLLNTLSENVISGENKGIQFRADEEGTLRIAIQR